MTCVVRLLETGHDFESRLLKSSIGCPFSHFGASKLRSTLERYCVFLLLCLVLSRFVAFARQGPHFFSFKTPKLIKVCSLPDYYHLIRIPQRSQQRSKLNGKQVAYLGHPKILEKTHNLGPIPGTPGTTCAHHTPPQSRC